MNEFLSEYPTCLYDPDRPKSLAETVRRQLQNKIIVNSEVPSWADSAKQLEHFFEKVIHEDTTSIEGYNEPKSLASFPWTQKPQIRFRIVQQSLASKTCH